MGPRLVGSKISGRSAGKDEAACPLDEDDPGTRSLGMVISWTARTAVKEGFTGRLEKLRGSPNKKSRSAQWPSQTVLGSLSQHDPKQGRR